MPESLLCRSVSSPDPSARCFPFLIFFLPSNEDTIEHSTWVIRAAEADQKVSPLLILLLLLFLIRSQGTDSYRYHWDELIKCLEFEPPPGKSAKHRKERPAPIDAPDDTPSRPSKITQTRASDPMPNRYNPQFGPMVGNTSPSQIGWGEYASEPFLTLDQFEDEPVGHGFRGHPGYNPARDPTLGRSQRSNQPIAGSGLFMNMKSSGQGASAQASKQAPAPKAPAPTGPARVASAPAPPAQAAPAQPRPAQAAPAPAAPAQAAPAQSRPAQVPPARVPAAPSPPDRAPPAQGSPAIARPDRDQGPVPRAVKADPAPPQTPTRSGPRAGALHARLGSDRLSSGFTPVRGSSLPQPGSGQVDPSPRPPRVCFLPPNLILLCF